MKRGPITKLILMILMKEKRIWLKKMMMTRMAMIPLIVQVNNPTKRRHLPQTEMNPTTNTSTHKIYFTKKEESGSRENVFHPMYHKMITKPEECQEEALECEPLVMATLLHPEFPVRFFAHCWPEREKSEWTLKKSIKIIYLNCSMLLQILQKAKSHRYTLKNMDHLPASKDKKSLLIWRKDHSKNFPILFSLAKDYLVSSASSCAADLNPQKIERCVSSHMWFKQGIKLTGNLIRLKKFSRITNNNTFLPTTITWLAYC
ncbi:hypothetical protein VP01_1089g10 [Puccinia sorghi]|uniref:HAT C-terminal dimerisation domain-containing protein n=1 Tax=Puccinia sorghi TaxID=27349 RepID=A0A0L6VT55_9BASI|nr:hypothetical protein VP01_1089g10 [Puccinia sorghi]